MDEYDSYVEKVMTDQNEPDPLHIRDRLKVVHLDQFLAQRHEGCVYGDVPGVLGDGDEYAPSRDKWPVDKLEEIDHKYRGRE